MRTQLTVTVFLCLTGAFSAGCLESTTAPARTEGPELRGSFAGHWDSETWQGDAYAVLQGETLFLIAHRPDPRYFYDEYIEAELHFTGPGTYDIAREAGRLSKITGGDAGYFPSAAGLLVVREFDSATRTVAGTLVLTADHNQTEWVVEGQFTAPVFSESRQIPWRRRP